MNINDLKERKLHGTKEFPVALYAGGGSIPYQWHDEEEIIYMKSGSGDYNINGEAVSLSAGECAMCPGRELHSMLLSDGGEVSFYALLFKRSYIFGSGDVCAEYVNKLSLNNHFRRDNEKEREVTDIIADICRAMEQKEFGYEFEVKALIARMYHIMIKNGLYAEGIGETAVIADKNAAAAIGYIHSHYGSKITVAELARAAGYSGAYFESFFKSYTGKSPVEYIIMYRLNAAREMLLKESTSVTDIAYECGFQNVSYFIRRFKAAYGDTPHRYRRNLE